MSEMKQFSLDEIQKASQKTNGKLLTLKQALFVQEYAKTGNASLSARKAYQDQKLTVTRQMGSKNLRKPAIQSVFLQLMEDTGLTDEYLISKVKRGIEETEKHFDYTKLALQLKGKLQSVSINLSHTISETRKRYDL